MGKEKEDASRITPPITNPSTPDISRPLYSGVSNYMPSYYGPMPHAWLPPFMPNPSSNPYPWTNQQHPWNSTCAAASSTAALSSSATLYSSAIPMMGHLPTTYPYPWSNQVIIFYNIYYLVIVLYFSGLYIFVSKYVY
ncbi:uncharacterized protein LOC122317507 [Carya illinoinensis]|uniref:uncharacterized protein LOC122317507 n=1 Tax=Carya illinoinensis TaxID=32201 RepID=UPI001C71B571|nr:uncharacterized protein LOC122317507 [Carya illinoinensis]